MAQRLNEYLDQISEMIEADLNREEEERKSCLKIEIPKLKKLIESDPKTKAYWDYVCNSADLTNVYNLKNEFVEWMMGQ